MIQSRKYIWETSYKDGFVKMRGLYTFEEIMNALDISSKRESMQNIVVHKVYYDGKLCATISKTMINFYDGQERIRGVLDTHSMEFIPASQIN